MLGFSLAPALRAENCQREREFFIDNLVVRIPYIIVMISGLASRHGSLNSLFQSALHLPGELPHIRAPSVIRGSRPPYTEVATPLQGVATPLGPLDMEKMLCFWLGCAETPELVAKKCDTSVRSGFKHLCFFIYYSQA